MKPRRISRKSLLSHCESHKFKGEPHRWKIPPRSADPSAKTDKLQALKFSFQDDNFSLSLLNELSVKYGIQTHLSHSPLPQKLEELREYLRREIKKELKIKEGAENLRKVAKDKKSVSDVNSIVKKSNSKLSELQEELNELESQILVSTQRAPNANMPTSGGGGGGGGERMQIGNIPGIVGLAGIQRGGRRHWPNNC